METRANRIKIISCVGTITGMKLDQIPKLTHFKFFNLRNANWFLFFHYPERIKQFLIPPPPPPPWILNYHTMVLIYIFTDFEEKRILFKKILTIICGRISHITTLSEWLWLIWGCRNNALLTTELTAKPPRLTDYMRVPPPEINSKIAVLQETAGILNKMHRHFS